MQASHSLPRALARPSRLLASLATAALLGACAHGSLPVSDLARPQPASAATRAAQQAALAQQPLDDARAMGFWHDDMPDDNPSLDAQGMVEVPLWRHAIINLPHPLLKQGLVILDTPGLNAMVGIRYQPR